MKQGDLVRLKCGSKGTPYSHGVITEIVEGIMRHEPMARVLWKNGVVTDELLRDFLHYYYEVYGEAQGT